MADTTLTESTRCSSPVRDLADAWSNEIRGNKLFYAILLGWLSYTVAGSVLREDDFLVELVQYFGRAAGAAVILGYAVIVLAGIRVLLKRPDRPLKAFGGMLASMLPGRAILCYAYGFAVFAVFMAAFLQNKALIPQLQPFAWDATFVRWDKLLFGGYHPWQALQPVLGYPPVTLLLDYAYTFWIPGIFLFWGWMIASSSVSTGLRRQYWTATVLSWIVLGIVMATLLSSAGPCFLPVVDPQYARDYAPLNAYLAETHRDVGLSSSLTKDHLMAVHTGLSTGPGGISAMPSMHNAQAVLLMLAGYRVSRMLGHALACYAALIFVASILLAWHYAVDGIIGIAGAALIWWVTGRLSGDRTEQAALPASVVETGGR